MSLRQNINKVHFDLTNRFEEVTITEKTDLKLGHYFELSILENNKEVKVILTKNEAEKGVFNWSYFSNPLNENSDLVERNSKLELFSLDIQEIIEKNRFDSDYIKSDWIKIMLSIRENDYDTFVNLSNNIKNNDLIGPNNSKYSDILVKYVCGDKSEVFFKFIEYLESRNIFADYDNSDWDSLFLWIDKSRTSDSYKKEVLNFLEKIKNK